jgi:hypothetical protein
MRRCVSRIMCRAVVIVAVIAALAGCGKPKAIDVAGIPSSVESSAGSAQSVVSTTRSPTSVVATTVTPTTKPVSDPEVTLPPVTQSTTTAAGSCEGGACLASAAVVPTTSPYGGELGASFSSPSNNIRCQLDAEYARCDVYENTWTVPPPPEGCDLDWGDSVVVDGDKPAALLCHGDATNPGPALAYGTQVTVGSMTCMSESSGMTCRNKASGHGFKASRGAFDLS